MLRKVFFVIVGLFLVVLIFELFEDKESKITTGKIVKISEGGIKDAVITIENDNSVYYINRALLEKNSLVELENKLIGKTVTIEYLTKSNIFNGFGSIKSYEIGKMIVK
ncbi:MAG: hypothetical protein L6Q46_12455 [Flavobacterium sp.]|uniref:hypothetical protein n=1 Tax=Flavobacterium sp. TaxID=239 RepID=UPI0025BB9DCE|nr:hypothetical protein [Flavobacterium sp.]MCK6609092.1 hypothetical protein [Flavobacterium sp.]